MDTAVTIFGIIMGSSGLWAIIDRFVANKSPKNETKDEFREYLKEENKDLKEKLEICQGKWKNKD